MRGKPGHRTAPSLEWREKMPRSERRDRKTCLCWKAFTLTHLYEDIKKNPSAIRAGGWATARCTARPRCQLSSCCREKKASRWPSGWRDSIGPPCPTTSIEVKASSQLRGICLSRFTVSPELFLTGLCCHHFICAVFVTIVFVHHNLWAHRPSAWGSHAS